jgi:hypothetical protein
MGDGEVDMGLWWKDIRERENLEDPGVDGRLIRNCVSKEVGWQGVDRIRDGRLAGSSERRNETSDCTKRGFPSRPHNC